MIFALRVCCRCIIRSYFSSSCAVHGALKRELVALRCAALRNPSIVNTGSLLFLDARS